MIWITFAKSSHFPALFGGLKSSGLGLDSGD